MLKILVEEELVKGSFLDSALHLAAARPLVLDASSNHFAVVKYLGQRLHGKAHIPTIQIAFLTAIRADHVEAINYFLEEHVDVLRIPFVRNHLYEMDFVASHDNIKMSVPRLQLEEEDKFDNEGSEPINPFGGSTDLCRLALYLTVKYSDTMFLLKATEIARILGGDLVSMKPMLSEIIRIRGIKSKL